MRALVSLALCGLTVSCVEQFNPVESGPRPIVVFALLNSAADTQVVRVHLTSLPSDENPGYPTAEGTTVVLLGPEGQFTFRDTLFVFDSLLRDEEGVNVYYLPSFRPTRGAIYRLSVHADDGSADAEAVVPGPSTMSSSDYFVLQDPHHHLKTDLVTCNVGLSPQALGFLVRLLIEYEEYQDGSWERKFVEVPLSYRSISSDYKLVDAAYPKPRRRTTAVALGGEQPREGAMFSNAEYVQTLKILYGRSVVPIRLKHALFVVSQADPNFFSYYSLANFFQDPNSIRVDQPDFSNISGALGFFGALTSDTLAFTIPPDLRPPN